MTDNKSLIINQFEENKGQFIIMNNKVVRLVCIAEDEMDYYYVTYNGRKINWHSCVGSYMILKGRLKDKDYNELIRIAKLNHFDQEDLYSPITEEEKEQQKLYSERHKRELSKVSGKDKYLVPFCWNIN
jgi:hypothetical protein